MKQANKNELKQEGTSNTETKMYGIKDLNNLESPPYHRDRLYDELADGSNRHASQTMPSYTEFRLGHGDPLLQATLNHTKALAHPNSNKTPETSQRKVLDVSAEKEIRLTQQGSPMCGVGMNDVIHLNNDTVIAVPCLPLQQDD
eukprot:scaffold1034_cov127-Cylindrotheca_fusiformis.AAC.37